jgi:hypothetical protein
MNSFKIHVTALCISAILVACTEQGTDSDTGTTLTWRSCTETPTLQCATLRVPQGYSRTTEKAISIGLSRLPVSNSDTTQSPLLNPGGSESSGKKLLESIYEIGTVITCNT